MIEVKKTISATAEILLSKHVDNCTLSIKYDGSKVYFQLGIESDTYDEEVIMTMDEAKGLRDVLTEILKLHLPENNIHNNLVCR